MNEFLRQFVMKTIMRMIDNNVAEWQVREYALGWYSKGVLTEEDLQEIDERYQPEETEVDSSDENSADTVENTAETNEEVENIESEVEQ